MKSWLIKIYSWVSLFLTIYFVIDLSPKLFSYVKNMAIITSGFSFKDVQIKALVEELFVGRELGCISLVLLYGLPLLVVAFLFSTILVWIHGLGVSAKRCEVDVNFKDKILNATKNGKMRWRLTEWDPDWVVYVGEFSGGKIQFMFTPNLGETFATAGNLKVVGSLEDVELIYSETHDLIKAIKTAGFTDQVSADRNRQKLSRREQLTQVTSTI